MPRSSSAAHQLFEEALRHHKAGHLTEAGRIYRQILAHEPRHADSLNLLGTIAHQEGELDRAIALIGEALQIQGSIPLYHNNLANALKDKGRRALAIAHYEKAILLNPGFALAHYNLGCMRQAENRPAEAIGCFERALLLEPNLAAAYNNLGTAYKDLNRPDDAIKNFRRAIELDPAHAFAHNNLGLMLKSRGAFDEALQQFRKATALKPDYVEAHVNEAITLLTAGRLQEGWRLYEWRWRMPGMNQDRYTKPLWDGSALKGRTILLHGEQGLGDAIQFVRYAPLVKAQGGRVVLVCERPLIRLFGGIEGVDQVLPAGGGALPDYDCHVPLLSLPLIFKTGLATIPNNVPYLAANEEQAASWVSRLAPYKGLKVGLVWAGNSRPGLPDAEAIDRQRSMRLEQFAPFAAISGLTFFSLQKGEPAKEAKAPPQGMELTDFTEDFQDFADTAALVAALDLVIGVDTSVIHLAGAMGKPVWVLSRMDGCWRWLSGRDGSPWYPTLRLFRQEKMGDWEQVIEKVSGELRNYCSQGLAG